jgi:hypothetical protein
MATTAKVASARRSLYFILRWPLLVAAASGFGLVAALVADGTWDLLAALALFLPAALTGWFWLRACGGRTVGIR